MIERLKAFYFVFFVLFKAFCVLCFVKFCIHRSSISWVSTASNSRRGVSIFLFFSFRLLFFLLLFQSLSLGVIPNIVNFLSWSFFQSLNLAKYVDLLILTVGTHWTDALVYGVNKPLSSNERAETLNHSNDEYSLRQLGSRPALVH